MSQHKIHPVVYTNVLAARLDRPLC